MLDNNPSTGARLLVILTTETEMRTDHSDDNEPITTEFATSLGFYDGLQGDPLVLSLCDDGFDHLRLTCHQPSASIMLGPLSLPHINTRGKLRRLISALNGD